MNRKKIPPALGVAHNVAPELPICNQTHISSMVHLKIHLNHLTPVASTLEKGYEVETCGSSNPSIDSSEQSAKALLGAIQCYTVELCYTRSEHTRKTVLRIFSSINSIS